MNCNIIKDLLPLYIDDCCSDESAKEIEEHLAECQNCQNALESMKSAPANADFEVIPDVPLKRISLWKASILQSVLFFVSFAMITVGAFLEVSPRHSYVNGFWAFNLIVPATGFLISLANWYFIRVYKSRKIFSNISCTATVFITLCSYIWAEFHYRTMLDILDSGTTDEILLEFIVYFKIGIVLTIVFWILSKVLSNKYAEMLRKE